MVLQTEFKNGEWDLVSNGSLIINSKLPTRITLTDDGEPLIIEITFNHIEESPFAKHTIKNDKDIIKIEFTNFTSPLGHFNVDNWLIGIAFDRPLYLFYNVVSYNPTGMKKSDASIKIMFYSFYLGKEGENG